MITAIAILIPIYILYIIIIGLKMFAVRFTAIKNKTIPIKYFKTYDGDAPAGLKLYQNHYNNQFQLPPLFLLAIVASLSLSTVTFFTVTLAYLFFASRLLHTYFHLGNNKLQHRGLSYLLGAIVLLALWVQITLKYLQKIF